MPEASAADEDYMFVEFDNHTRGAIDVSQAWINLPATTMDKGTQKTAFTGDITSGVLYNGKLPPGKTTTARNSVFVAGLSGFARTPKEGFRVEFTPKVEVRLTDGKIFSTSNDNAMLSFDFRRVNATEVEAMKPRFKQLLTHPDDRFASAYYLTVLSQIPEVANSATLDELLSALKSHSWVDGKGAITEIIGKRFPDNPRVIGYFLDQLSREDGDAFFSFPREVWPNPAFVEPLVKRYERKRDDIRELEQLRTQWVTNQSIVARLSITLLQKHPVLNQKVADLSGTNLCDWCSGVSDAGVIGNTNFLNWLAPALEDKRITPDCIAKWDSRPRPRWRPRVCDCALSAILMIVDGNSWSAFKLTGEESLLMTQEKDYLLHDQVIADVKKRLRLGNN